ncbi:MAG: hypothetical protein QOE89_4196 [Pseudonocardiales bacterium]|nr:hypothetical protein [Pseudonocardiales bacterium]
MQLGVTPNRSRRTGGSGQRRTPGWASPGGALRNATGHIIALHETTVTRAVVTRVSRGSILFTFTGVKATDLLELRADLAGRRRPLRLTSGGRLDGYDARSRIEGPG